MGTIIDIIFSSFFSSIVLLSYMIIALLAIRKYNRFARFNNITLKRITMNKINFPNISAMPKVYICKIFIITPFIICIKNRKHNHIIIKHHPSNIDNISMNLVIHSFYIKTMQFPLHVIII